MICHPCYIFRIFLSFRIFQPILLITSFFLTYKCIDLFLSFHGFQRLLNLNLTTVLVVLLLGLGLLVACDNIKVKIVKVTKFFLDYLDCLEILDLYIFFRCKIRILFVANFESVIYWIPNIWVPSGGRGGEDLQLWDKYQNYSLFFSLQRGDLICISLKLFISLKV